MADVVVLGAGVSGHTAALHLSRLLPAGNTVTVVDGNFAVVNTIGVGTEPYDVVLDPNGTYLYVADYGSNTISRLTLGGNSLPTGVVDTITSAASGGFGGPVGLAITPGRVLYVTGWDSNTVQAFNLP